MDGNEIIVAAKEILDEVVLHRRHIHKYPELSFQEYATSAYIKSILDREGIPYKEIAGTGVLASIEGCHGDSKDAVVLRADIDALPVCENNECEYSSQNKGVMHACGHDMHTAALLGALSVINKNRSSLSGTILGLFQPGEELCPGGASMVLAEKPFDKYNIRAVVGQHVDPDLPSGKFGIRAGKYMASSDELRITVKGIGGHGALPHKLKDPVVAAAALITALQQINSRIIDPNVPSVLSIGKVIADGATNVIPDSVYLEGTFRTFDENWREEAKNKICTIARSVCEAYGTQADVEISDGYPCVVNSEKLSESAESILHSLYGENCVMSLELRSTAEDFGYYTQLYPSLFYRIGVGGDCPDKAGKLHTSVFNPDENALENAVAGFVGMAYGL